MFTKFTKSVAAALVASTAIASIASAEQTANINDFHRAYTLEEITPKNMQSWPYYNHVSMNWDSYSLFGTAPIAAPSPVPFEIAAEPIDLGAEFAGGKTFVQSFNDTQTKGALVMKDGKIVAEYYANGFTVDQTQLLQSSTKTYAGIIASKLIDQGKLDPTARVDSVLKDFKGSAIGAATIQHVLDMQAGLLPATDYHVPGGEAFMFEIEQGLKPGDPVGHRASVIAAKTQDAPGDVYTYNDKNTDILAMLAEEVEGKPFAEQLGDLFGDFGAQDAGSISLTVDGTTSPSYGISTTLRDYGLFHQWIAEGDAPESFYASVTDVDKDLLAASEKGKGMAAALGTTVTYGSQGWYIAEHNMILSIGSYGQVGVSDMDSGVAVVFMQDWEDNGVAEKLVENVERAKVLIEIANAH